MVRQALIEQLESRLFMTTVVSGDFTGDGRVDIVTTQGGLRLRVGNGNGTFRTGVPINGVGFARGASVAAADFNNDDSLDLAVFGGTSTATSLGRVNGSRVVNGGLFVLLNNGNGTFQRAVPVISGLNNSRRTSMTTGDFNTDGNQDILITSTVAVATTPTRFNGFLLGPSFGAINPSGSSFFVSTTGGISTLGGNVIGFGTFTTPNLFGTTPVSVGTLRPPGASVLVPGSAIIINGNGDGTFQAPQRIFLT